MKKQIIDPIRDKIVEMGKNEDRWSVSDKKEGLYLVGADVKCYDMYTDWWFVDDEGKNVFGDKTWEAAYCFSEGLAAVQVNRNNYIYKDKWGFIDKTGELVIPDQFHGALSFINGVAPVVRRVDPEDHFSAKKVALINRKGELITDYIYDGASEYESVIVLAKRKKCGFLKTDGSVDFLFSDIKFYDRRNSDVLECITNDGGNRIYRFFNQKGERVNPYEYTELGWKCEGMMSAKRNGKWAYLNDDAEEVIEPAYDKAGEFNEGRARVVLNGKKIHIDKSGNVVK